MLRNVYLKGIYKKSEDRNRKPLSLAISFLLIFGAFIVMLGTVIGPPGQEHKIWGTANEGVIHPGVGVPDGREISGWIDGVTYGNTLTVATTFDLYIDGDNWGVTADNNRKDGGWYGDMIYYFLDYDPMDYFLNVSHTTSSFNTSFYQHVDSIFFNRTDQAPGLTTLRMLKTNEIVLDPDDGLPQYVIVYDPGQNLGMNNITDYYLQKDDNVTHSPDGETFDFLTHVNDIVDMSNGYYYINLTSDLALNDSDEIKLVWKSPYAPNPDPALTGPGNGTDIIVDRVEWGNYTNYISPVTPPDDRDYDNTTLLDFIDTASLYGTGASMIRTDDQFSPGYSGNGTDTDNCLADFKVLGQCTPRPQQLFYPVHNIDTDEYFDKIQAAIDDPDTQDGHTIEVAAGKYIENVVVNKTLNLTGEDKVNTIIDGGGSGDVVRIDIGWVNITDFTITNGDIGINIWTFAHNVTLANNNVLSNYDYGISLSGPSDNKIINNNVSMNIENGIRIYLSENNHITNNFISNNGLGIRLYSSLNNNLSNNYFVKNGIYIRGDELSHYNSHNISTDNMVNGKSVFYYKDCSGINIDGMQVGQLILANCTNITVKNLNINNTDIGIEIAHSNNVSIVGCNISLNNEYSICLDLSSNIIIAYNNITNNWLGIFIWFSLTNNITCNTLSNNVNGIYLWGSSKNKIFHNVFIDSNSYDYGDNNLWNDTYPFGGNYWSDYSGDDKFKGPQQNLSGRDGIGDDPYTNISGIPGGQDNYPLMGPFPYFPTENYSILKQGWNLISLPLIQEVQNLTTVLQMIDGYYDAVQWYNNTDTNDPWKHHKVGKPFGNDLSEINETMGFLIHITQPGDAIFLYNGTQPTSNQSITLHPGWNMVGYPSPINRTRDNALNNINYGPDVDAIWTFNAATQTWQEIGPTDNFRLGRGYWIHSKVTKVWDVPL